MDDIDLNFSYINANVILAGFPKCATTALAQWLQSAKEVTLTGPKETYMLCPEYWSEQTPKTCERLSSEYSVRIEATTLNIYSEYLINLLKTRHEKVIILVRDIEQVAISWHKQMIKADYYSEGVTLTEAYESSPDETSLKNYKNILAHGAWVEKWIDALSHERVLILDSMEVEMSAESVKRKIEKFLGLKLSLEPIIPKRNVYSEPRFKWLYGFVRSQLFKNTWYGIEAKLPRIRAARIMLRERVLLKTVKKDESAGGFAQKYTEMAQDQMRLADILKTNSAIWRG